MRLGIGADAQLEFAGIGQRLDQLDGRGKALRMRGETFGALRRIAAQRDNLGDARVGIGFRDLKGFGFGRLNASQMRGDIQAVILADGGDRLMRQLAGGAAGAIGDRHKAGFQRRQDLRGFPQPERGIQRLRREEFKADARRGHGSTPVYKALVSYLAM